MAVAYTSVANLQTYMGISDTNADAALTAVATAVNAVIEDYIGFGAGVGGTAAQTYDGDGTMRLFVRGGLTGLETLEIADQTGGTFGTYTDYVLKGKDTRDGQYNLETGSLEPIRQETLPCDRETVTFKTDLPNLSVTLLELAPIQDESNQPTQ